MRSHPAPRMPPLKRKPELTCSTQHAYQLDWLDLECHHRLWYCPRYRLHPAACVHSGKQRHIYLLVRRTRRTQQRRASGQVALDCRSGICSLRALTILWLSYTGGLRQLRGPHKHNVRCRIFLFHQHLTRSSQCTFSSRTNLCQHRLLHQ